MSDPVTFASALGDPTRWRIVRMALDEALCICELADVLGMPQSSISSHVQILRRAALLESEKQGKWAYFRILPRYRKLILAMEEQFPEADRSLLKEDAAKLAQRLAVRAESCCPGPERLARIPKRSTARGGAAK